MKNKPLKVLRITALVIGWILIANFIRFSLETINMMTTDSLGEFYSSRNNREIVYETFSKFGGIFLAFLISAVVRMIERQAPVGIDKAKRLMIICCLSYMTAAFGRICIVISDYIGYSHFALFNLHYHTLLMHISNFSVFVPVLYAVSIFVLYSHFTKMVTFESEVA